MHYDYPERCQLPGSPALFSLQNQVGKTTVWFFIGRVTCLLSVDNTPLSFHVKYTFMIYIYDMNNQYGLYYIEKPHVNYACYGPITGMFAAVVR